MPNLNDIHDGIKADIADLAYQVNEYNSIVIAELAKRDARIITLEQQLADLTRPRDRVPLVSKATLRDTTQLTITLDASPSPAKDKIGREMILLAKQLGFNAVRFMRNAQEIATDTTISADNPRNLPALAKANGLLWFADSLDAVVIKLTAPQLKTYCAQLKQAGACALFINDGDRASIKGTLPDMLKRIRDNSDLPIIGSLSATADQGYYRTLFDHIESQVFGSVAEFVNYLKLPSDVLCLDGQSSASISYLDATLAMPALLERDNLTVYTAYDVNTRWTASSPTALRYATFLKKWNGAA